jgi:16S rRNA (uracil1498-N3)-methyltransferase
MNLILLQETDFIKETGRVRLEGRRMRHISEVHRAATGEELCVGLEGGLIGSGIVTLMNDSCLEMEVDLHRKPPEPLPATLAIALPRPKVLKRVLLSTTSMGVKRIIIIHSWRVERSYWQSPVLGEDLIRRQLVLGLEQARDTIMPEVLLRPLFKPFVEDELPGIIKGTVPIVADPSAQRPCPRSSENPITIAVGPEGGFIPYEIEKLLACGFSAVNMGERILRVETVIPALLSRLF